MKFKTVSILFSEIDKVTSRIAMTELLAELFGHASGEDSKRLAYLCLGSLNPPYIGTQFSIAKKNMTKIVARVINDSEEEVEEAIRKIGDVGSVVTSYGWEHAQDLTLEHVYNALLEIEAVHGTGSQEKKALMLYELLKELDPESAKYVVRIVLGTLRLGFSDMTLLDAFSWMKFGDKSFSKRLVSAYNVCADIGLIIKTLQNQGPEGIEQLKMQVGIPVRPAAAERLPDAAAIIEKIGTCVVQPKIDGFRLQVHVDLTGEKPLIRFFSRNLLDMSAMFPEFVEACKKLSVKKIILDGEAMVHDPNTGQFMPFQETVKRRRKHGIDLMVSELPLQLHVFDILYLDGESCLHLTQNERRETLKDIFSQVNDSVFVLIEEIVAETSEQLESYFIREIAAGLEGIIAKKPNACYQPGKRDFNWIKLKYQASEKLEDTLDVVVLGYYPGLGKRAKFGIGAFLVGIYDPRNDSFETVAKIGTGLTDEKWIELKQKCDALKVNEQPKNVVCHKSLVPFVWVHPEIVCEVLADEITVSPVHTAGTSERELGFALRFPRFLKYREDKSSHQTTTVAELEILHNR